MRIIHTSDWHLGQNFYGYDRAREHRAMVDQLKELILEQKPDLLVIAGDIYDAASPGANVQKQFCGYILELKQVAPHMPVVCISGNHDSSSRHEIFQQPWEALNVYMIGKVDMNDLRNNIIKIGNTKGYVVAVPYTNERFLDADFYKRLEEAVKEVTAADNRNEEGVGAGVGAGVDAGVDAGADAGVDAGAGAGVDVRMDLPVIYVGHAAIQGCNFAGHSNLNDRYIGGIECTSIEELGDGYDYIALGHIHKAQTFGQGRARYCGSPLPVGFDEVRPDYIHGFSVVEILPGEVPYIENIPVETPNPLVNIPAEGYAPWKEVMDELKRFPADLPAYIRLNVLLKDNEMLPYDKEAQIKGALEGKQGKYALINPARELSEMDSQKGDQMRSLSMEELQRVEPATILKEYAKLSGHLFTEDFEKCSKR